MIAFGPVPSRRFGRSLGVNNIPAKRCSYSCVYCQVGPTTSMRIRRRPFLRVEELVRTVAERLATCRARNDPVDYVTFVPDGEPTLDALLGPAIRGLKALDVPIAVITNGSLLWRRDVQSDLAEADVVSVKVDSVDSKAWHRLNRPMRQLRLPTILRGIETFAQGFSGELWTETMLVDRINDGADALHNIAAYLHELAPARAYLAVPTRPTADPNVRPPSVSTFIRAREIFRRHISGVETLAVPEEGRFGHGDDPVDDLLAIMAVHPMPEGAAREYLEEAGSDPAVLDELVDSEHISLVGYRGRSYVTRASGRRSSALSGGRRPPRT